MFYFQNIYLFSMHIRLSLYLKTNHKESRQKLKVVNRQMRV